MCHVVRVVIKDMPLMEVVAVQGNEERPGLLGYSQGNTVLVLLLSQRYLKQPDLVAMPTTTCCILNAACDVACV